MNEAVLTGQHFHEGTKLLGGDNLTLVGLTHFNFLEHAVDEVERAFHALLAVAVDAHRAVLFDVDIRAGLSLQCLDVLTAGANKLTDAILRDAGGLDTRGIRAHGLRSGDAGIHGIQHVQTTLAGHMDGFLQNVERNAGQLKVKLVAGHTHL